MKDSKYPTLAKILVQAEGDVEIEQPEERVDTSAYSGPFELSPEVEELISEYDLQDDIEPAGEGEETKEAKLKPDVAEDLARTANLFLSREAADERLEGMGESLKAKVLEIGKEVAPDFDFAVEVTQEESNVGNPSYWYDVKLSKGNSEKQVEILNYSYEPGIALSEGAESWEWAAWLGVETSPFYNADMSEAYDYDQMSIAMEQFLSTFKESQEYWDLKDAIKAMAEGYAPQFKYVVDHDERGEYRAHVENDKGEIVYELKSNEEGELEQIEDGFMRSTEDMDGLAKYLKQMDIMPKNADLVKE